MGEAVSEDKRQMRTRLREARRSLNQEVRQRLSELLCRRLVSLPAFASASIVIGYEANDGEIDPKAALGWAVARGARIHFPMVRRGALEFRSADEIGSVLDDLRWEMGPTAILVPGVAFDGRGFRLGRGKGHYDRTLPDFAGAGWIGLAYELQMCPDVPREDWDLAMDYVITEARVLRPDRARAPKGENPA